MQVQDLIVSYSKIGDMITVVCCATLLILISTVLYFSHDSKFSYLKRAVHFILFGAVANIAFSMVCQQGIENELLIYGLRNLYHLCLMFCLYLFILYMKAMLDVRGAVASIVTYFTRVFFVLAVALDFLSPLTHFGFHQDDGLWHDPLLNPYNVFYCYGVFLLLVMLVAYSDRLIKSVRRCLIATEAIVLVIMVLNAQNNTNTMSSFTYVLPILVVMILLHSKPFDDLTGAMGADSFESYIKQVTDRKGRQVDYMVLKLTLNPMVGMPKELAKILNSFWHNSFREALLFRIEHDLYVLAVPRDNRNGDTEAKMLKLFNEDFQSHYAKYQIPYKLIGFYNVDFIRSESDMRELINYLLITMKENTLVVTDERLRDQLRQVKEIRNNLMDIEVKCNLDDPRVLAYCQPIKNMKTGHYDTAEALMRMQLPEIGMVFPNLFIPLAEHYGHIHTLTKIMLNKVCKEVKALEEEGYQFKRISVNFAASEIRAEDFCEEILEIVRSHGIDPAKIGIELTESQTESDFMIVKNKVDSLRGEGMTLYLDDVGTGYSNLDRIVRYEVDVVKFDRFFLLEAEKSRNVESMMMHLANAFKDLDYELLYEGVETEENESLCLKCGADYIQGFKYSKPLPIEQMRDFFEKKEA